MTIYFGFKNNSIENVNYKPKSHALNVLCEIFLNDDLVNKTDKSIKDIATTIFDQYESKWCCLGKLWDNIKHYIFGYATERSGVRNLYQKIIKKKEPTKLKKTEQQQKNDPTNMEIITTPHIEEQKMTSKTTTDETQTTFTNEVQKDTTINTVKIKPKNVNADPEKNLLELIEYFSGKWLEGYGVTQRKKNFEKYCHIFSEQDLAPLKKANEKYDEIRDATSKIKPEDRKEILSSLMKAYKDLMVVLEQVKDQDVAAKCFIEFFNQFVNVPIEELIKEGKKKWINIQCLTNDKYYNSEPITTTEEKHEINTTVPTLSMTLETKHNMLEIIAYLSKEWVHIADMINDRFKEHYKSVNDEHAFERMTKSNNEIQSLTDKAKKDQIRPEELSSTLSFLIAEYKHLLTTVDAIKNYKPAILTFIDFSEKFIDLPIEELTKEGNARFSRIKMELVDY